MNAKFILAAIAVGAVTAPMVVVCVVVDTPTAAPDSPAALVQQIDAYAQNGQWKKVHKMIDYRSRGRDLVPDLWDNADKASQLDLVTMLQGMFRNTWEQVHALPPFETTTLTTTVVGPSHVMVEQNSTSGHQAFRYWFEKRDSQWTVVDRTVRKRDTNHEPSGKVRVIRARIKNELGTNKLTLRDFVANAPSWVGRVRARRFKVRKGKLVPQ